MRRIILLEAIKILVHLKFGSCGFSKEFRHTNKWKIRNRSSLKCSFISVVIFVMFHENMQIKLEGHAGKTCKQSLSIFLSICYTFITWRECVSWHIWVEDEKEVIQRTKSIKDTISKRGSHVKEVQMVINPLSEHNDSWG